MPNRPQSHSASDTHPQTVAHLRCCRHCRELLGLALAYLPVGRCVVRSEAPGTPAVEVRQVGRLYWVLMGERVQEVTEDQRRALSVGDRLSAEALLPEPSPVRLTRGPDGWFRVRQGGEELARARNPKKLRAALRLAEPWMPEDWWTRG